MYLKDVAYMTDKHSNLYVGEALELALLLRCKVQGGRNNDKEIKRLARLLGDQND